MISCDDGRISVLVAGACDGGFAGLRDRKQPEKCYDSAADYKKFSSAVGFKGIAKKVVIFILVGVASLLDSYVLGEIGILRTAVIFFYLSNEGLSLLENAAYLGLPIPSKLKMVLEQLHDRNEKEGGDPQ